MSQLSMHNTQNALKGLRSDVDLPFVTSPFILIWHIGIT